MLESIVKNYIISKSRHSLKKLTRELRSEINLEWFNRDFPIQKNSFWQEYILEQFPDNRLRDKFDIRLVWQDEYNYCGAGEMWSTKIPYIDYYSSRNRREEIVTSTGFIYKLNTNNCISIYNVYAYYYSGYQDQLIVNLIPPKSQIRQLEGLIIPKVIPFLNKQKIPDYVDYTKYYNIDDHEKTIQGKVQNHWDKFFD